MEMSYSNGSSYNISNLQCVSCKRRRNDRNCTNHCLSEAPSLAPKAPWQGPPSSLCICASKSKLQHAQHDATELTVLPDSLGNSASSYFQSLEIIKIVNQNHTD